jgi:hypothetical protein
MIICKAENMQQQRSYVLTIISIAIIIGGIVIVFLGTVMFSGTANLSDSVIQDSLGNKSSTMKSKIIAKTATNALAPLIKSFTQVTKMFFASIASFLCLVGVGLCVLGFGLFKTKYLALVLTIVLMFLAIVIDVVGLGFIGGSFTHDSNNEGIIPTDLAYIIIAVLIIHLVANSGIIYYLTRKNTILYFRTTKT